MATKDSKDTCDRCGKEGHDFRTEAGSRVCNKLMMQDPDRWPGWPFLPVKCGPAPGFGLMAETAEGVLPHVLLTNLFARDPDAKVLAYDNFEDLLDAGWVVD